MIYSNPSYVNMMSSSQDQDDSALLFTNVPFTCDENSFDEKNFLVVMRSEQDCIKHVLDKNRKENALISRDMSIEQVTADIRELYNQYDLVIKSMPSKAAFIILEDDEYLSDVIGIKIESKILQTRTYRKSLALKAVKEALKRSGASKWFSWLRVYNY